MQQGSQEHPQTHPNGWDFWIDIGGTFTDCVARSPLGKFYTHKLLSSQPYLYADPVLHGIHEIISRYGESGESNDNHTINEVRLGTTIATNTLLERKGCKTALLITKGFADALKIGYQNRPDIFSLQIQLTKPLYQQVLEIDERINAEGHITQKIDKKILTQQLTKLLSEGIEAVAIVFMHGYRYPEHENQIAQLAHEVGFKTICTSHEVSPMVRLIPRGETCVVNAYLSPQLDRYIKKISDALKKSHLFFMQSNGGLADPHHFQAKDALLSGPAGGVVGAVEICAKLGIKNIIGFDMGGTSTDVCHYKDHYEYTSEREIAGIRITAPMLDIHTVAAGGGSICQFTAGELRVGPQSAGADPGPACYGKGGPLTITDCHLFLGHLQVESFPIVFGPKGDQPLDREEVIQKLSAISETLTKQTREHLSLEHLASGFIQIATEHIANAIKKISIAKGHDVRDYTLVSFGGAAGQHACAVASLLGIQQIISHPYASVLSAVGIGISPFRVIRQQSYLELFKLEKFKKLSLKLDDLCEAAKKELMQQDIRASQIQMKQICFLAYHRSDAEIEVPFADYENMVDDFQSQYQQMFGYILPDYQLEVRRLKAEAYSRPERTVLNPVQADNETTGRHAHVASGGINLFGETQRADIYQREQLSINQVIDGPIIITEKQGCQLIPEGWQLKVAQHGELIISLKKTQTSKTQKVEDTAINRALFANKFMAIAEQMGSQLRKTALSVNIKERLDFSCALFNKHGDLIANAPHLPVHLGSMGESVRAIIQRFKSKMQHGDAYLLNSPYHGGTHLPDLTVINPVFIDHQLQFFVASRAHHADVGGKTPGSFPADSREIYEEGVVLEGDRIVSGGQFLINELRQLLNQKPYPVRNITQNIADIQAQIAANQIGIQHLRSLVEEYSLSIVTQQMNRLLDHGEYCVKHILSTMSNGQAKVKLDNGAQIQIAIQIARQKAVIDFKGTSKQQANNFNAPYAVTRAAILYVFRTLIKEKIPLNEGCLRPIVIKVPAHNLLNPDFPAAVVAGNVETSQQIVNVLYQALGVLAESQGTMNNVIFGNENFQYYETICGGAGAGDGFNGADAVHTHMTNSRLTDPELLELNCPVMNTEFSIRQGSAGEGRWHGGEGVIRKILFLEDVQLSLLTSHRVVRPKGIKGGGDGQTGENILLTSEGKSIKLDPATTRSVKKGDQLIVKTPGGGGYGKAKNE